MTAPDDRTNPVSYTHLQELGIDTKLKMKTLSKGNKEKVQLVLVMSRQAKLYLLDEPIAGVDPAARDFILSTILNNYNPDGTVLILSLIHIYIYCNNSKP